ncbi:Methyl sulfide methyltransferase-associated sensor [uncultured archaeon]|nr:Methyl sulfide methyltransferase-associated sensor [uncultured archaeon]
MKNTNQSFKICLRDRKELVELKKQLEERTRELEAKKTELNTKLKEAEEMRIATLNMMGDLDEALKELKTLDKLKAEFMNVAAHELKTPLTPMIAYIDMLITEKKGKITPRQKETLQIVFKNLERLKRLINDVLDISRLEAKAMKMAIKDVNITILLREAEEEYRPAIEKKKLKFITNIPSHLPNAKGDYGRLRQAVGNLLNNALKFTEKGTITLTVEADKDRIKVTVTDTGIGIKEKDEPKIFQKFYQAETSPERKAQGTGLGLPIVKGIIEAHKGKMFFSSKYGKGSTFGFYLPYK